MPRKKSDHIVTHRYELSPTERKLAKEFLQAQKGSAYLSSIGSIMQGIGVPLLGAAALIWVGFNIDDFIDNTSTRVSNFIDKRGLVNYQADEIGREIQKVNDEQSKLFEEYAAVANPNLTTFNIDRKKQIDARMKVLEKREIILREMLDKIVRGEASGWVWNIYGSDDYQATRLQNWYEAEGGQGDLSWDIDYSNQMDDS